MLPSKFNLALSLIKDNRFILLILLFYLALNFINLTKLPVFNDESIYLNWGWVAVNWPGHLYDSLSDAKQPLMMWLFGIFGNLFSDPLFGGRSVSVLIGGVTLLGVYATSKKLFDLNTALIAAFIFSITPIFAFYNRQVLLESGIMCVGIWAFYYLIKFLEKPLNKTAVIFGIILGIGFLIKTTSLIFILTSFLIITWQIIIGKKHELIKPAAIVLVTLLLVDALILINPVFWQTLPTNSRYSFTFFELLSPPIVTWIRNSLGFFEIGLIYITPLIFISGLIGLFLMIKNKTRHHQIFIIYFLIALLLEFLLIKTQSQRYLVSFLLFIIISSSYVFSILWKGQIYKKIIVVIFLFIPLISTLVLILNPFYHISRHSQFSKYAESGHIYGQTSGYGINDAIKYINSKSPNQISLVFVALNSGNPENAVYAYARKSKNLLPFYLDSKMFEGLDQFNCFSSKYPVYFITRYDQAAGLDKYFTLEKEILTKNDDYYLGIFTLKRNCEGKTLSISDLYENAINVLLQMKQ